MRPYDPTISALVGSASEDWGDTERNVENIIQYGIPQWDCTIYGIDLDDGELIAFQGIEKSRKTTVLLNIALYVAAQLGKRGCYMSMDTLESGMTPRAYRDALLAIIASRLLIDHFYGNDRSRWPSYETMLENNDLASQMIMDRHFFKYGFKTPLQQQCISRAMDVLSRMPLAIFGAPSNMGRSRDIKAVVKRWDSLYHGDYIHNRGSASEVDMRGQLYRIFSLDPITQVSGFGSDYFAKHEAVVGATSEFVVTHPGSAVILITHVSATSYRSGQEMDAKGGRSLRGEATAMWQTFYDGQKRPWEISLEWADGRYRPPPTVLQEIDPSSGTFLSLATNKKGGIRL